MSHTSAPRAIFFFKMETRPFLCAHGNDFVEREKVRLEKGTHDRSNVSKEAGGYRSRSPSAMGTGGLTAGQGYWGLRRKDVDVRSVGH